MQNDELNRDLIERWNRVTRWNSAVQGGVDKKLHKDTVAALSRPQAAIADDEELVEVIRHNGAVTVDAMGEDLAWQDVHGNWHVLASLPTHEQGMEEHIERSTRESRGGPQFPEVHRVRRVLQGPWFEGSTEQQAIARMEKDIRTAAQEKRDEQD